MGFFPQAIAKKYPIEILLKIILIQIIIYVNLYITRLFSRISRLSYKMTKRHMDRCSALIIIREMQIKSKMNYHFILVRMAIIKKIYKQ